MASIEDSGSFDHSSNLCGTKYFFSLFYNYDYFSFFVCVRDYFSFFVCDFNLIYYLLL